MKAYLYLLILFSIVLTIKPMESQEKVPYLPTDVKYEIAKKILAKTSLEDIINSLNSYRLVNKQFLAIISNTPEFKPFFELDGIKNPITALKFIYDHQYFEKYSDWVEYLHKKFPYLTAKAFEKGLDVLKNPPASVDFAVALEALRLKDLGWNKIELTFYGLLLPNANINGMISGGLTRLIAAIADRQIDLDMIKFLLAAGADVNFPDQNGDTPLMVAINRIDTIWNKYKTDEIINLLLEKGADVNAVDEAGNSVIELAIQKGKLDLVKLFAKHGAIISDELIKKLKAHAHKLKNEAEQVLYLPVLGDFPSLFLANDLTNDYNKLKDTIDTLEKYKNIVGRGSISKRSLEKSPRGLENILEMKKKKHRWQFWK